MIEKTGAAIEKMESKTGKIKRKIKIDTVVTRSRERSRKKEVDLRVKI